MFRKISTVTVVGVLGGCFFLPESYFPGPLKPINHMMNVASAGLKMGYIYKFSHEDIKTKNEKASQHLKKGLQKNGGIYVKLGQLIATLDVIVPIEFRTQLMALTRDCPKSEFQDVKSVVESQLNKPLQQVFSEFEKEPIASASIGQVHRARLKTGEEVAVKVQHKNLSQNVEYDLKLMKGFVKIAKTIFSDFKYSWLIEQFDKNIHRELDFVKQAQNSKRVKNLIEKQNLKNLTVPDILLTPTKKLLVMEFINGLHMDQLQEMKKLKINTKMIGKKFANLIIKMIHKEGFVHADPHSGNLLVRKNKNNQDELVILDHGLYQELDESLRINYNRFWLGLILNDQKIYVDAAKKLGTNNGILLCCMLTSQTSEELSSTNRKLYDLNPGTDQQVILKHAQQWQDQIVEVLNELRRQTLLLLKVNEFARTIQNMLGGREMGVYEDIATCCVENIPLGRVQKYKYYWKMLTANR